MSIDEHPTNQDLLEPEYACPKCGERDMDRLVWLDDERVRCSNCGTTYCPGESNERRSHDDNEA